jgi:intracellular sulfur oxidation DsrE/DsrF family protein
MYIDLQDFVNNLQDVLGEIYSYLTRNSVTEEVVVHGTTSQHFKANLTGTKKGTPTFISKKLSWMKLIGIKLSLIVCDNSSKKKFKISTFKK